MYMELKSQSKSNTKINAKNNISLWLPLVRHQNPLKHLEQAQNMGKNHFKAMSFLFHLDNKVHNQAAYGISYLK